MTTNINRSDIIPAYKLQIWKLDANREFTSDDPYMDESILIEDMPKDGQLQAIFQEAHCIADKYYPVIDCAGYRAIIMESRGDHFEEVGSFERMY